MGLKQKHCVDAASRCLRVALSPRWIAGTELADDDEERVLQDSEKILVALSLHSAAEKARPP